MTAAPAADVLHRPGSPGYRRLNVAMVLAGLAAFGLLYAAQPVLPQLADEFGVRASLASLAVSATTGALAIAVLPAAVVARRWGRARTMRWGLVASVVLTLGVAVAPTFGSLVVLRALSGLTLAAVAGVAMAHVGAEVHPAGLGSAMGLYVAGNSLGGVGGRLVTSFVSDGTSWRWGVAAVALAGAAATAAFWRTLPATVARPPVAASERERVRPPWPLLVLVLVPFTLMGGFVAVYNYLGFRLSHAPFDLAPAVLGLVFLAYLAGTFSSAVAGRAADRLGRPRVLTASVLVMAGGLALTLPDVLWLVVAGLVVLTAGFFAAHAVASGWAPVVAGAASSLGSALYVTAYYAGSSVFGLWIGEAWTGAGWPGVVVSVALLCAAGLVAGVVVAVGRRSAR
ncbi:MFS transporter, YNFM family, putative membrane transport protein [Nocardioides scoriae]|uniref:MFS transporter, YNFM family, putative membrane transport protein n=1 Tax=Nocardioides scoriae TaxID=642780 RepID=A0A1H1L8X8_9ACTN|nr:MFS transporter, YNFM family, putative membrane transport protein [Nocardioides scoriae]